LAKEQRRLAAIMFVDVAGYSKLTEENEELAIEMVRKLEARLVKLAGEYQGRMIKSMGDGFLFEFESSLEAVNFAISTQRSLHKSSWRELAQECPALKIGIHMGDVEHIGSDIYGDTVNVASRIEPLAGVRGGICISEPVYEDVRDKVGTRMQRMGELRLKNVRYPVGLYRIHFLPYEP